MVSPERIFSKKHEKLPSMQLVASNNLIKTRSDLHLILKDFVFGTMPRAKSSLHWPVVHYQVTSEVLSVKMYLVS